LRPPLQLSDDYKASAAADRSGSNVRAPSRVVGLPHGKLPYDWSEMHVLGATPSPRLC